MPTLRSFLSGPQVNLQPARPQSSPCNPRCAAQLLVVIFEQEKQLRQVWYYQLGPGGSVGHNIITEHQHQIRPFCVCDGAEQKRDHLIMFELRQEQEHCLNHTNDQTSRLLVNGSGCYSFTNCSIKLSLFLPPPGQDLFQYPVGGLSPQPHLPRACAL